jgi:hypothetical protein
MPRSAAIPALCLAVLSLGAGLTDPARPEAWLQVQAKPAFTLEPGRVTITVRHSPHPGDRRMTVEADSGDFFRSSTFPLDGERARTLHDVMLRALPAGEYRVRVVIDRNDRETVEMGSVFRVCHSGGRNGADACGFSGAAERRTQG